MSAPPRRRAGLAPTARRSSPGLRRQAGGGRRPRAAGRELAARSLAGARRGYDTGPPRPPGSRPRRSVMPDWQERITRDTAPGIRVEHAARYRFAAPVIAQSEVWADLGCGNGTAAADGVGQRFAGRLMLVDIDENALRA